MNTALTTLGPPRHQCYACGKCCFGHDVTLLDAAETARIERYGELLGVLDPVVDGSVRFEEGRCTFLGDDLLCTIHAAYGEPEKPWLCQQFPIRGVRTETGELRMCIEPTCTNTWRNWDRAPVVSERPTIIRDKPNAAEAPIEAALLRMASHPQASVGMMLHVLAGQHPNGRELPQGFDARLITRIQDSGFSKFLWHPEVGWGLRQPLEAFDAFLPSLDPSEPPAWPALSEAQEAAVMDTLRRMIFLRNGALVPATLGVALLTLSGAVLLGWSNPKPELFGPALACWCRCIQFRALWLRLLPSPEAVRLLATGR